MMGKKVLTWVIVIVMMFSLLTGCASEAPKQSAAEKKSDAPASSAAPAKKITIRIGHDNSVQAPGHRAFLEFKKMVESKSGGRIEVLVFPSAQLGSGQDMLEQTRRGDIQMSVSATALFTQSIPEFAVWDSFYMFEDAAHAHRVLDGKAGKELLKPLDKLNLTGLGYMEIGFRNFSNSKRPIEKLEDVKGLKIRGYNPIQIKAWESVGASLTNLAWAEVFTSLQQNLIDGQECATESFYSAKFYEAQKYWSLTKHIYTNWMWFANKAFMEGLSAEDKKIIEDSVKETIKIQREFAAKQEEESLAKLPGHGIKINEVPLEARKAMGKAMNDAVKDQIIARCGKPTYDMVMAEIEAQRKK